MNEKCQIIFGYKIGSFWFGKGYDQPEGTPVSVDFDAKLADKNNLIGWYHTHPHGCLHYSQTDFSTMVGWTISQGKPLLCIIGSNDKVTPQAWVFTDIEEIYPDIRSVKVWKFGKYFICRESK